MREKVRCLWVNPKNFYYTRYHDEELGLSFPMTTSDLKC